MILVAGEAVIDLVERHHSDGGHVFEPVIGGSPLNVSVGLARLGQPVAFLGALSGDRLGMRITAALGREGVNLRFTRRSDRPSSLVLAALDDRGVPDYTFFLAGAADFAMTEGDLPMAEACFSAIHFGSVAAFLDPTGKTLADFVAARRMQSVISFDPNMRPTVTPDRDATVARFNRLLPFVDILKASAEDVDWLYSDADLTRTVSAWSQLGPRIAVVTAGPDGAFAAIAGEVIHVPSPAVSVVDTIGAGDTFQAALLDGLASQGFLSRTAIGTLDLADLRPIIERAATAAAITCSRRGADLPRAAELSQLVKPRQRTADVKESNAS
ncbi:carbohydrate kinase [Azospirillum sp. A29]|uniref:carbohydrate kinase family protein n=1 Tax=unclassified Azospirillum TaxID=2630922 RepID=UPI00366F9993